MPRPVARKTARASRARAQWVVLDAMGVMYPVADDVEDLLVPFIRARRPDMSTSLINAAYRQTSLGRISARQFWRVFALEDDYPAIERRYLHACLRLAPGLPAVLAQLRARYRLAMLSNDVADWSRRLRVTFDLNRWFGAVVISGEARLRKPDPRIYRAMQERIPAAPWDIVFVDDRAANLQAAAAHGWRTLCFARVPGSGDFIADAEADQIHDLPHTIARVFG